MRSEGVWAGLYLFQLVLWALAAGTLSLRTAAWLRLPAAVRFGLGFCAAPYVSAALYWLLSCVWRGAPAAAWMATPAIAATVVLAANRSFVITRIRRLPRRCARGRIAGAVTALALVAVLAFVGHELVVNTSGPTLGFDFLQYLREARPLADTRDVSTAFEFTGSADGTLRGDAHSYLFPYYLAQAQLFTGHQPGEIHADLAARWAVQALFLVMLAAVLTLGVATRSARVGALGVFLLLLVPDLGLVVQSHSRESFRIIPLLLVTTCLMATRTSQTWRNLALTAGLSALCSSGHTLGNFIVPFIGAAWLAWALGCRLPLRRIVAIELVLALGLLLGANHNVRCVLATGKMMGTNVVKESAIAGTVLEARARAKSQQEKPKSPREVLGALVERDGGRITVTAMLAALLTLLRVALLRASSKQRIELLALIVIAIAFPFLGVLDPIGVPLSQWFTANIRYPLHWHPFGAVLLAALAGWMLDALRGTGRLPRRIVAELLACAIAVGAAQAALQTIRDWNIGPQASSAGPWLEPVVTALRAVEKSLRPGQHILLDDGRYSYYLDHPAILIYSTPTLPLLRSADANAAGLELARLRIGAVALLQGDVAEWWDQTAFYRYLDAPGHAEKRTVAERVTIFKLPATETNQPAPVNR